MTKTRVPEGERYWSIRIFAGIIDVESPLELNLSDDDGRFASGTWYIKLKTKEENIHTSPYTDTEVAEKLSKEVTK